MTSYQKLKREIEKLESDKALLLKSMVYPKKMEADDNLKLITMKFDYEIMNRVYNVLCEGDYTGELPTGIINFSND